MSQPNKRPHGQLRHSQVITTFGPGSLVDLPNQSAIVGGLEHWFKVADEVHEPRLIEKLKRLLNLPALKLFSPPPDDDDPNSAQKTGLTAWQFPEWFITQDVAKSDRTGSGRARHLVPRRGLVKGKLLDDAKKKHPVVPVRFVRACRKGHIGDIDWYKFVHRGTHECRRPLWMVERGTSGDLAEVFIRCECGEERRL